MNTKYWILALGFLLATSTRSMAQAQLDDGCVDVRPGKAIFENDWLRVKAWGWSVCHPSNTLDPRHEVLTNVGLFRKDDYKLYVITHTDHASPGPGGRSTESSPWVSPWVEHEVGECDMHLDAKRTKISDRLSRVDLYFDAWHASQPVLEACGNPESKKVLWYGSYFSENCPPSHTSYDECGSFFITYPRVAGRRSKSDEGTELMNVAVSFATSDPDYLPSRGDSDLDQLLKEVTNIVRHIKYK